MFNNKKHLRIKIFVKNKSNSLEFLLIIYYFFIEENIAYYNI